jgi:hypothetical protein
MGTSSLLTWSGSNRHARHLGTTTGNAGLRQRLGGIPGGRKPRVITVSVVQGVEQTYAGGWEREQDTYYVGNRLWLQAYPTSD